MAKLKLGHTLLTRCDPRGNRYLSQAEQILSEMEALQLLDPNGGLFYTVYSGADIVDFARAPSAAGTLWMLMVQQASVNEYWRETFWGSDQPLNGCSVYLPMIR